MYVRRLTLKDLRAYDHATMDFVFPGREQDDAFAFSSEWPPRLPNVNLIIGVNGMGKSTILDGVALAILAPVISSSGYRPYLLVRRARPGAKHPVDKASLEAELVLDAQDGIAGAATGGSAVTSRAEIIRRGDVEMIRAADADLPVWSGLFEDESPAFLLTGYGASRRVEAVSTAELSSRRKVRQLRYERVASLFEEHFALMPLNAWLPELAVRNPGRHVQVVRLLNRLMPPDVKLLDEIEDGDYLFLHRRTRVPFGALSDGFKSYIGWIGDLLHHVTRGVPSGKRLVETNGVVLVDEIDLHIHPEWQRELIPVLASALPRLQFIFTTHSPLVVGSLERANIYHLQRSPRDRPIISRPVEEVYGLTSDQILRSDVFGLDSTRAPQFKKELDDLSQRAQAGEAGASLAFMNKVARGAGAITAVEPPAWVKRAASKAAS